MDKVTVREERFYGKKAFYPVSENAKLFCQMIPRSGHGSVVAKSLTEKQLGIIKQLGFEIEVVADVTAI